MFSKYNKRNIKYAIYIIISVLFSVSLVSSYERIKEGLSMIINGECGWMINRLLFQHPFCIYWNDLLNKVSYSLHGDRIAIGQLTLLGVGILSTPQILDTTIDRIAETIGSGSDNSVLTIDNGWLKK